MQSVELLWYRSRVGHWRLRTPGGRWDSVCEYQATAGRKFWNAFEAYHALGYEPSIDMGYVIEGSPFEW